MARRQEATRHLEEAGPNRHLEEADPSRHLEEADPSRGCSSTCLVLLLARAPGRQGATQNIPTGPMNGASTTPEVGTMNIVFSSRLMPT